VIQALAKGEEDVGGWFRGDVAVELSVVCAYEQMNAKPKKLDMSDMSDMFWSRRGKMDIFWISEQTCHDTLQKLTRFPPTPLHRTTQRTTF
jgi:hypothetical protein